MSGRDSGLDGRDDLSNQPPQRFHRFHVRQARPLQSKDEMVNAQVVPVVSDLIYRRLGRPDDESVHPEFVPVASQRVGGSASLCPHKT